MHDDDPDRPSSEQAGWVKLAADLRDRLDEMVDDVPGMEPPEAAFAVGRMRGWRWATWERG